ncbi:MAG: DUF4349 domain-containing protein [bacterium]
MRNSIRWGVCAVAVLLLLGGGCKSYYSKNSILPPRAPMYSVSDAMATEAAFPPANEADGGEQAATTGDVEQTTNASERLMTYDATLRVVVQNIAAAMESLKVMTSNLQGYMQSMAENSITVRIPAARLNAAFEQVGKLGEITSRTITGDDVTEEMMDLDIRLRTTEDTRNRLVELLKKSDKVEDLLKVEKELQRVIEALELIKGRIKYLAHAVAYSTLTVELNSPVAQTEPRETIPFAWVRSLATDIVLNPESSFTPSRQWRSWLKMEWPSTFVKLFEVEGCTRAMSGNGVMLLVKRHDNFEGGTPVYWTQIIRRWLVGNKVIALGTMKDVVLINEAKGTEFVGTKAVGRKEYQYMLVTVVNTNYIYTIECWGPAEELAKERDAIEQSVRTMKVKP